MGIQTAKVFRTAKGTLFNSLEDAQKGEAIEIIVDKAAAPVEQAALVKTIVDVIFADRDTFATLLHVRKTRTVKPKPVAAPATPTPAKKK